MNSLAISLHIPCIIDTKINDHTLTVELDDGRTISVPTAWYPRLMNGTQVERDQWRIIGKGAGIHWESLDEDISVEGIIAGRPSGESQASLKKWLDARQKNRK